MWCSRLLVLWHHLWWNWSNLYIRVLAAYQHIHVVHYLSTEICLLDCTNTGSNHQWPEYWRSDQAHRSNDCFVDPLLMSNHSHHTAR